MPSGFLCVPYWDEGSMVVVQQSWKCHTMDVLLKRTGYPCAMVVRGKAKNEKARNSSYFFDNKRKQGEKKDENLKIDLL